MKLCHPVTDNITEANLTPVSVEEWVFAHMGNHIESWVEDFLQYDPECVLSDDLINLTNWNIEGAAGYLESELSDLASTHRLYLEDDALSVFGTEGHSGAVLHFGDLYSALLELHYTDPAGSDN